MNLHQYDLIPIDSRDLMIKALLGSSNQAVFLPPVSIRTNAGGGFIERQYADGGNREVIPSKVVVNNLDRNGSHEIYVLSNNPHELDANLNEQFTDLVKVLVRALVMFLQEGRENDLDTLISFKFQANDPSRIKIFYIHPGEELDPEFPTGLRFDIFRMRAWMREGKSKAADILARFPNGNVGLAV